LIVGVFAAPDGLDAEQVKVAAVPVTVLTSEGEVVISEGIRGLKISSDQ
jgi:hypothetical protein